MIRDLDNAGYQEATPVAAPSLLSVKRAFDAVFGKCGSSVVFQRMLNEFPFHEAGQPGKGLLIKVFMLEALNAEEAFKRAAYEELKSAFSNLKAHLEPARTLLAQVPSIIKPAGSAPETAEDKARANARDVMNAAGVLAVILPMEGSYEHVQGIMTPLVARFKAAIQCETPSPVAVVRFYEELVPAANAQHVSVA